MDIFLIGQGNVGTALSNFLQLRGITCEIFKKVPEGKSGIIFLAVSDSAVKPLLEETLEKNPEIFAVHFSAATRFEHDRVFLLHPFCSINKESDFSRILFTLWGSKNSGFEQNLEKTSLKFIFCGRNPGLFYHTAAVISGNFTQFFVLQALKLLEKSGFSKENSTQLLRQLLESSVENVFVNGINGITGPAARGEKEVLLNEYNALKDDDPEVAGLFKAVNEALFGMVSDKNPLSSFKNE